MGGIVDVQDGSRNLGHYRLPKQIGDFGVMINAWLAVFNMIPVSVLDGRKVMAWDRRVYGVAVGIVVVVLVMSMMI